MSASISVVVDSVMSLDPTLGTCSEIELPKKKSRGHRCYFCGQKFMDVNVLRKHISVHKDRDFVCDVCGKTFAANWGLRKHMKVHTGERPFACDLCGKSFAQKCTLQFHLKSLHGTKQHPHCLTCGKRMKSFSDKQCWLCRYEGREITDCAEQAANEVKAEEVTTDIDQAVCEVKTEVRLPVMESESQNIEISQIPNSETTDLENQDVLIQPVSEAFDAISSSDSSVNFCSVEFEKMDAGMSSRLPYTCFHCQKQFPDNFAMAQHLLTHPDLKPFVCQKCGRDFIQSKNLNQHKLTHKHDRPFKCQKCQSSFKSIPSLKQHMSTHNDDRPFACKDCGGQFKSLQALKTHVVVHSKVKPLSCKICGRTFSFLGNLQRHIRVHTGERPYKCKLCDKGFSQSNGLKAHVLTHQKNAFNVREEMCGNCGKKFRSPSNFRKHMLMCFS